MKTYQPKAKDIKRGWHLIDAKGEVLGRLATKVANLLMGKQKSAYSAHMDSGDYVVIVNSEKVVLTGKKKEQKVYQSHSGYPGGFKEVKFAKMAAENPAKIVEMAVSGMLPKNKLRQDRLARLKVIVGEKNPYEDKVKKQEE